MSWATYLKVEDEFSPPIAFMQRQQTSPHLMLYLEWILLAIATVTTTIIESLDVSSRFPFLAIACMGALAVLGLRPPSHEHLLRQGFTLAEFGLILLPYFTGDLIPTFPVLGLVLVIRSAQRFALPGRLKVAAGVYASYIFTLFFWKGGFATSLSQAFGLDYVIPRSSFNLLVLKFNAAIHYGMVLTFTLLLVNSLMSERENRKQLSLALTQLRKYALQIEDQATLQERNRIAREIHDALGHTLTAQSVQLDSGLLLFETPQTEQARSFFNTAKSLCTQALQEVRQSVSTLRSDCLLGNSLEEAVMALVRDLKATTAIAPEITIELLQPLSSEVSSSVYRIIQAALTNIICHSAATEMTLQLTTHNRTLYLVIKDNGRGFNPAQNSTGFGIQGMRERALALEGQFHLFSEPGEGCLITVQIPLSQSRL